MMNRVSFKAKDGKKISVLEWGALPAKGIIQISHGMAEHAGRYEAFGEFLAENGYFVFCDDHRAHGKTSPKILGYEDGDIFEDTLSDMHELTLHYKEKYGLPVVLFGHSYGSFLSQAYLERFSSDVAGIALGGSSYMKNATVPAGRVIAGIGSKCKGATAPGKLLAKMSFDAYEKKVGGSFISSIPAEAERYKADKDCGFTCSYAFYKYFFKGLSSLYKKKRLQAVRVPVLLIAGENDPVGDFSKGMIKLKKVYEKNGIRTKLVLQKGVRHEYLNDVKADEAKKTLLSFFDACIKEDEKKKK